MGSPSTLSKMSTNSWSATSSKVGILQCIQEARDSIRGSVGALLAGIQPSLNYEWIDY